MVRRRLIDVACGLGGLAVCAGALLLQSWSETLLEYALIVLPLVVFPLITWLRRDPSAPWAAFVSVNVWLVIACIGLARLASAAMTPLLLLLLIGAIASACVSRPVSKGWAAAALIAAALAGVALAPSVWSAILTRSVRQPAPDVAFETLDGRPIRLTSLRGNVVVLNFWGVWCGPCVQEMAELEALMRDVQGHPVRILAVNSGIGGETPADIRRFLSVHHLAIPVVLDASRNAYRAFGVAALPTTLIIDSQGVVRARRVGFAATAHYRDWLARQVRSFD